LVIVTHHAPHPGRAAPVEADDDGRHPDGRLPQRPDRPDAAGATRRRRERAASRRPLDLRPHA
jgi:hypothetical protein